MPAFILTAAVGMQLVVPLTAFNGVEDCRAAAGIAVHLIKGPVKALCLETATMTVVVRITRQ